MARSKSFLQIQLEYYPIVGFAQFLKRIPISWAERLGLGFLTLLLSCLPKRRSVMHQNLARCFPDLTINQRDAIANESLQTLARGIAYLPRLRDLARGSMDDWVVPEGFDYAYKALEQGRGLIAMTAHIGFWEMVSVYIAYKFPRAAAVARPLDNPKLDRWVNAMRTCTGTTIIPQHHVLKEGLRQLRRNAIFGILIDQNLYKGGLFVDFFGRPAATTTLVSLLARRTGSPVIPLHSAWDGRKLRMIFEPPLTLSTHSDPQWALAEDTQTMTRIVERWVREDPGQWLWLHNRWKRKPEAGDFVYPGLVQVNNVPGMIQG